MLTVSVLLKDGTELNHCGIYKEGIHNESPVQDENEIRQMFSKIPWGVKTIYFQNMVLQGNFDASNVNGFTIHK